MPFIVLGALIFLDQFRRHGRFLDTGDTNNHETWGLVSLALGVGMLYGASEKGRR